MSIDSTLFMNPTSAFRTAPLWVWNDDMNVKQIQEQLRELKNKGFGGAFVHPRPGLITEYLSDAWFQHWEEALTEAEHLGMKLYIYDENSYPSGFAGGHVSSQLPDCLATGVIIRTFDLDDLNRMNFSGMSSRSEHLIRIYAYEKDSESSDEVHLTQDLTKIPITKWKQFGTHYMVVELGEPKTNSWFANYAYTDLLRPEVTQLFLSSTYEAYRERFGSQFGHSIPAIFTDEPQVSPGQLFEEEVNLLPFSYWFAAKFEERNGYDIKDLLPCLFMDVQGETVTVNPRKVRYDYYCTIRELWVNNFVRPISEWCDRNQIHWTGHYLEHNWPYPWGLTSPSVMSLYEYMQWPAIDMLMTSLLKERGTEDLVLTIREVQSVANQFNRERVLCETYGAGGWDSTFRDYKRIGDWLMVHGINFLNQHLTYSTLVGARKRDHPQSFDWRQPWWNEYRYLADYHARLSYALSQGQTHNRILLLNPTTSTFLQKPSDQAINIFRNEDNSTNPDLTAYLKLIHWLIQETYDFDLGDEFIMERHGHVEESKLMVAERAYDVCIVPAAMTNMKETTVNILQAYSKSGGMVLLLGEPPKWVDGSETEEIEVLADQSRWLRIRDLNELAIFLNSRVPRRLTWENPGSLPTGVSVFRRDLDDGSALYFLVNSSQQPMENSVWIQGEAVEVWDPWSGKIHSIDYENIGGTVRLAVEIPAEGSILLRVYNDDSKILGGTGHHPNLITAQTDKWNEIPGSCSLVHAERENIFTLDFCDLRMGSKEYSSIHTIHANRLVYEHHGFPMNPWDNSVQYRHRVVDQNVFHPQSGFDAVFHFDIDPGYKATVLQVFVERPEFYTLTLNGHSIPWEEGHPWLDSHMGMVDIAVFVHEGENELILSAHPFDVLLELESIYLYGDFRIRPIEGHWVLSRATPLQMGSWKDQGYPFYGDAVQYQKKIYVQNAMEARVRLQKWNGTVASVIVNDQVAGLFGTGQGDDVPIGAYLHEGENVIKVRVCGSFKNLLGPHHNASKFRNTAWPGMWKNAPFCGPSLASEYDLIDYGLFEDFIIEVKR